MTSQTQSEESPRPAPTMPNFSIDYKKILSRVKEVLLSPNSAWQSIKDEPGITKDFYRNYFFILLAVPPIGYFLGELFQGHFPLLTTIVRYLFGLIMLLVSAMIAEKLAPKFGGATDLSSTVKLCGFSSIPSCVAGVFSIFGSGFAVTIIWLVAGLYGLKILWEGISVLTSVPESNRLKYLVTLVAVSAAIALIVFLIALGMGSVIS